MPKSRRAYLHFVCSCVHIHPQKRKSISKIPTEPTVTKDANIVVSLAKMRRKRKYKGFDSNSDEIEAKAKEARLERNLRVLRAASDPTTDLPVLDLAAKLQS